MQTWTIYGSQKNKYSNKFNVQRYFRKICFTNNLYPDQRKNEFCRFIELLNKHKISVIVEIGTAKFITFASFTSLFVRKKQWID